MKEMFEIVITTANARYSHSSLGLRYLYANLGELQQKTLILEHTIKDNAHEIMQKCLSKNPKIIGIGIYIWNVELLTKVIKLLKSEAPHIVIIIGGPEVSYGLSNDLDKHVDYIIQLEGELAFKKLTEKLLAGKFPSNKVIKGEVLNTEDIQLPYEFYNDSDVKNRKIYVEASRGCAFKCHFCLSSLDDGIRNFNIDDFLFEMKKLYQRGVRQFKFVDRTFNLDIKFSTKILRFFLDLDPNQNFFLHFEVIPDRLPVDLKSHIELFRPGVLQFEVGIQSLNKEVSDRIGRKQNKEKALHNLKYLRQKTNAHLHVDLIIGLPGADLGIFKSDLNELISIGLQEVQVGILKNLKGTPLSQHIESFEMKFNPLPPYEILSNKDLSFEVILQLQSFQKFWDKYFNSSNFKGSMKFLFNLSNPFDEFFEFSLYSFNKFQRNYGLSLDQLVENLHDYFLLKKNISYEVSRELILKDILQKKDRKIPKYLRNYELGIPDVEQKKSHKALYRQSNN
ncbi:MAG: DUF4080 domain-containing protein [Bacteriovoracaceae bacterium]|nr:DUF4080 domain-containing protein [Bacteriovoracaceae bacterium]